MIVETAKHWMRKALRLPTFIGEEERAYARLAARGWAPSAIIDVGAYEGHWTRLARRCFPDAPILMVEAQADKSERLRATCIELGAVDHVTAVLGERDGETVTFYEMETGSSLLPENSNVSRTPRVLSTRTLDEVASHIAGPIFLKVDVQGAELQVLRGGLKTLDRCALVQLEVALLPYNEGAPSFLETIAQMDAWGFVPFDFSGFSRPNQRDLVQTDILFTKRDSPLRSTHFIF